MEEAFRQSNEALEAYLQRLKDALGEVREMLEEQCGEEEDTSSRHAPAVGHREIDGCCAAVTQAGGPQTVSKEAVLEYLSRSTASPAAPSSPFPKSIGTCLSHWMAVGVVRGSVKWGHYSGQLRQYAESLRANPNDDSALPQLVAEFVVETHGYVERMPGQMMLYRNQVPVRVLFRMVSWPKENGTAQDCVEDDPWSSSLRSVVRSLKEGDLVQVHGQYGLHASFDVVTRRLVENVVVEADVVSLLSKK